MPTGGAVVLQLGDFPATVSERLGAFGEVVSADPAGVPSADLLDRAVAVLARASADIDGAFVEAAPRLRVIGRSGVGVERIDVAAATARAIPVVVTPGAAARAVAESALALTLSLVKRLPRLTNLVRQGRWQARESTATGDVEGATLGLVGLGRIGREVATLADAVGMRVIAYDPYADATTGPVTRVDLETLARTSDVVSLHAPLTAETERIVDHGFLRLVRHGMILVNCARGGLIDADAVAAALGDGRLGGVGLDVFDPEPPSDLDHPLFAHPDVVFTPHLAGLSPRAMHATYDAMCAGVETVLRGDRAPHVANPAIYEPPGR